VESFKNQVVVITGASGSIGKAIAVEFAAHGATVCLVGRNRATLEAIAEQSRKTTARVLCYLADLSLDKDVQTLATKLRSDFDRLDILVHSAGVISWGHLEKAPIEDLDYQYRVNVRMPYLLTQTLLPLLRSCQGQIMFVNSSLWLNARAGVGQYTATKYALKAISDSLRDEVNGEGLRVLSVFLGRTAGHTQEKLHKLEGKAYHPESLLQPEDVAKTVVSALGLPRTAEVTDIHIRPFQKPL
jgi:NADP-dependent 3-hydroxy acid dehydrogenase YdfG